MKAGAVWSFGVVGTCFSLAVNACASESRTITERSDESGGKSGTTGASAGQGASARGGTSSAGTSSAGTSSAGASSGGDGTGGAADGGSPDHAGEAGVGGTAGAGNAGGNGNVSGMGGTAGVTAGSPSGSGGMPTGGSAGSRSDDDVAVVLDGHTILMPVAGGDGRVGVPRAHPANQMGCTAMNDPALAGTQSHNSLLTMGGTPGVIYDVRLRARGLVESKTFTGGTDRAASSDIPADGLYTGGRPDNSMNGYASYMIRVASPRQDYFLNSIGTGSDTRIDHSVYEIDFEFVLPVEGGTTVCLVAADPNTSATRNCAAPDSPTECLPVTLSGLDPLIVDDIGVQPYSGQFIGLRVLGVMRAN